MRVNTMDSTPGGARGVCTFECLIFAFTTYMLQSGCALISDVLDKLFFYIRHTLNIQYTTTTTININTDYK